MLHSSPSSPAKVAPDPVGMVQIEGVQEKDARALRVNAIAAAVVAVGVLDFVRIFLEIHQTQLLQR